MSNPGGRKVSNGQIILEYLFLSTIRPKKHQICFPIFAQASKMWSNTKNKSTLFGSTYDNKLP